MIASTHRAHAHTIAKGTHINAIMAEMYGKAEGCSGGYGGSMHLYDVEKGNLGANAVVGGGLPQIAGAALAFKLKQRAAGGGRVLRRRRHEHRRVPRVDEPRAAVEAAGGLRAREQRLGGVDARAAAAAARRRRDGEARARVRDGGDGGRRAGRRGRPRRHAPGPRARRLGPRARVHERAHLPVHGPLRRRPAGVPGEGRGASSSARRRTRSSSCARDSA